jgi:hypothetical protein
VPLPGLDRSPPAAALIPRSIATHGSLALLVDQRRVVQPGGGCGVGTLGKLGGSIGYGHSTSMKVFILQLVAVSRQPVGERAAAPASGSVEQADGRAPWMVQQDAHT